MAHCSTRIINIRSKKNLITASPQVMLNTRVLQTFRKTPILSSHDFILAPSIYPIYFSNTPVVSVDTSLRIKAQRHPSQPETPST